MRLEARIRSTSRPVDLGSTPASEARTASNRSSCTRAASVDTAPRVGSMGEHGFAARHLHLFAQREALVNDLHVHRVVLHERRRRDDRHIEVILEDALRERLEAQVALLDRSVAPFVAPLVLNARELGVEGLRLQRDLRAVEDLLEFFLALEEPPLA